MKAEDAHTVAARPRLIRALVGTSRSRVTPRRSNDAAIASRRSAATIMTFAEPSSSCR
jgi:hypothetical protein